jgi:hypothetical protein
MFRLGTVTTGYPIRQVLCENNFGWMDVWELHPEGIALAESLCVLGGGDRFG